MLAWREHTSNTPKWGSQQTQLRTVEGLAFGPGVSTPNPQQASKQARERERERQTEGEGRGGRAPELGASNEERESFVKL